MEVRQPPPVPKRPPPVPTAGRLMKAAREEAGMGLDTLAKRTRISRNNLEALERDDYGRLPAPVYVRGYLRCIAQELGRRPETWLQAYDREEPGPDEGVATRQPGEWLYRPLLGETFGGGAVRVGHVLTVLILILSFFLLYFALEGRGNEEGTTASSHDASLIEMLDRRPIQRR